MAQSFIVLDLETTGLDAQLEGILEIAAVRLEDGHETAVFHTLTRPGVEISPESQAIHGITEAMIADAPEVRDVLDDFLAFVGDTPLVAHNAPFDISFLDRALGQAGRPALSNPVHDSLEMAREVFPEQRSYKLEALCRLLGHEAVGFHRALDDTRHLAKVFPALWRLHEQKLAWYQQQFGRIEGVARRHELVSRLIDDLQSELAEHKRVLTRYFQAHPDALVPLPGGDTLGYSYKPLWDYQLETLRPLLVELGLADRLLKLDRARLERWLTGSRLTAAQREAIAATRLPTGRTGRIVRHTPQPGGQPTDVLE